MHPHITPNVCILSRYCLLLFLALVFVILILDTLLNSQVAGTKRWLLAREQAVENAIDQGSLPEAVRAQNDNALAAAFALLYT